MPAEPVDHPIHRLHQLLCLGFVEPAADHDLDSAAGCVVRSFPNEGQAHVTKELTAADFKTNPPTSGDHNVTPAQDGVYAPWKRR